MTIEVNDIAAVILAGGRGQRMGGIDKGLQMFRQAPLALHAMMRISPQVGRVMINANRNIGAYEGFGVQVVIDEINDYAGPLAGMHAALGECHEPYLVTVPCDVPEFPLQLVEHLKAPFEANPELQITVASCEGQAQPVFLMMKTEVLEHLGHFMSQGGRKIDRWYESLRHQIVEFELASAFHNVNTLEELRQLEQKKAS